MSDAYDPTGQGGEPSTDAAPFEGTPAGDEQIIETPPEAPRQYLDLDDDLANRYVRVKVDGEELEVPLSEALSGYSRTADYTRKTQTLAEQRAEAEYALTLQRALQAAPEDTIRLLAQRAGIDLGGAAPPQHQQSEPSFEDSFSDPLEQKIGTLEQRLQQLDQERQQAAANQALQAAIGGLQSKYQADDATVREVVTAALQNGFGPQQFDMLYRSIMFERNQRAQAEYAQRNQQQEQQRRQAGQAASQVTGSGGSAAGAGAPPPPKTQFNNYREAIEAAFEQIGS